MPLLFALGLAGSAQALTVVTWTMTVTNSTTNGNTAVIAGSTRTATNALTSTTWVTNSTGNGSATNLYSQLGSYPVSGVTVTMTDTNKLTFRGDAINVTQSGNWCTLTAVTNGATNFVALMVPPENYATPSDRTNNYSAAARGLDQATNSLSTGSTLLKHFGDLTTSQTASNKTFFAVTNRSGLETNVELRGVYVSNYPGQTNGSGIRFGNNWLINDGFQLSLVQGDGNAAEPTLGSHIITYYWGNLIYPQFGGANSWNGTNVWNKTNIFGGGSLTTNALVYNLSSYGNWFSNTFSQSVIASNCTVAGTNQWIGDIAFPWYDLTTLGATNNYAIPIGTNRNIRLSGPTAAFTISGIAGGRKGREITLLNASGYAMTLSQNTVDPTPENRIVCRVAGDITFNDGDWVDLKWDHSVSKWRFTVQTAYNTNDVSTGQSRTNFSVWPSTTANNPITINGLSGQTAELSLWVSNGTTVARMHPGGNLTINSLTNNGPSTQTGAANMGGNVTLSNNLVVAGSVNLSNLTVTASNTTSVPFLKALPGGFNTNAAEIKLGPAIVGGFQSNGIAFIQWSNSPVTWPACYRVFAQTSESIVTNITTATNSLVGTGVGSVTLTNGFWTPGRSVRLEAGGFIWTPAAPGNSAISMTLNGVTVATNWPQSLPASLAGDIWEFDGTLTCWTNSASIGYISAEGRLRMLSAAGGSITTTKYFKSTQTFFDTTAAGTWGLVTTNGAATIGINTRKMVATFLP